MRTESLLQNTWNTSIIGNSFIRGGWITPQHDKDLQTLKQCQVQKFWLEIAFLTWWYRDLDKKTWGCSGGKQILKKPKQLVLCRYARLFLQAFLCPSEHLCPSAEAACANAVALLLNAEVLTQREECKPFWKPCTTLFWMQICHSKRLKEGHLLLLVLVNAIASSNLPSKLCVWALTGHLKKNAPDTVLTVGLGWKKTSEFLKNSH